LVLVYWLGLTLIHFTIIPITKIGIMYQNKFIWLPLYLTHQCVLMGLAIYASEH